MEIKEWEEWENYEFGMETVVGETPVDQSRWKTSWEKVVRDQETGKYYLLMWESGSTEYQDMNFEDEHHEVIEVEPYEETVIKYRAVNG